MVEQFLGMIFDNDGTIADSEAKAMPVAIQLLNTILEERGADPYGDDAQLTLAGKAFSKMLEIAAKEKKTRTGEDIVFTQEEIALLARREEEAVLDAFNEDGVEPTEGAVAGIRNLFVRNIPIAVASTSSLQRVKTCLKLCDVASCFGEHVYSARELDPPMLKPHPGVYLHAAKKLDLDPKDCVAVEDSISGVESALRAGVGCVIVFTGASHFPDQASKEKRWQDAIALRTKLSCEHIEMRLVQTLEYLDLHLNRNLEWAPVLEATGILRD